MFEFIFRQFTSACFLLFFTEHHSCLISSPNNTSAADYRQRRICLEGKLSGGSCLLGHEVLVKVDVFSSSREQLKAIKEYV